MSETLKQRQQQMMAYLLQGESTISSHIVEQGKVTRETRLHIYRNAYQARLRETIDVDHPVTGSYLGDDMFEEMVAGYREEHLSSSRSLRQYGHNLPLFLARREPFCQSPQIAELARFERVLMSAFDAADSRRIEHDTLVQMPATQWPEMAIGFHPSVQLFESDWNAVNLWQALKAGSVPPPPQQAAQAWLVWRNRDLLTEFFRLNDAELCFYEDLQRGCNLAHACEALLTHIDAAQLGAVAAASLSRWSEQGLISQLKTGQSDNSGSGSSTANSGTASDS